MYTIRGLIEFRVLCIRNENVSEDPKKEKFHRNFPRMLRDFLFAIKSRRLVHVSLNRANDLARMARKKLGNSKRFVERRPSSN